MSAIPSAAAAAATTQTQSGTKAATNEKSSMDKDGFLKLFIAQLTHQDPTSPMDANESVAQMASFTMVEQITSMTSSNAKIVASLNTSSAVGLIGRTVTYLDANDVPQTGKVERVTTATDGSATLTVGGVAGVDPRFITEVA